jgi:hypothetical protein
MQVTMIIRTYATTISASKGEREGYRAEEFCSRLSQALGVPVPTVDVDDLGSAPADGFLLLFKARGLQEHPRLGPRSVVLALEHAHLPGTLERHSLAAGVEHRRYLEWQVKPDGDSGDQLFGRKEIAPRIKAEFLMDPVYTTEHYGLLGSRLYRDLPTLLAAYLVEYERLHPDWVHPSG